MTRKEQIKERAHDLYGGNSVVCEQTYIDGARWADAHPHWVSVEDELPEENKWVLTYNRTSINLLMLAGNGGWYDHSAAKHRNITHWMPLPQPPKKGGEE